MIVHTFTCALHISTYIPTQKHLSGARRSNLPHTHTHTHTHTHLSGARRSETPPSATCRRRSSSQHVKGRARPGARRREEGEGEGKRVWGREREEEVGKDECLTRFEGESISVGCPAWGWVRVAREWAGSLSYLSTLGLAIVMDIYIYIYIYIYMPAIVIENWKR
jgi:hypothetical protein